MFVEEEDEDVVHVVEAAPPLSEVMPKLNRRVRAEEVVLMKPATVEERDEDDDDVEGPMVDSEDCLDQTPARDGDEAAAPDPGIVNGSK